jgi:hypothetical protein
LQTEEYAQALTLGTGFVRPDHAERFVSFRQARAQRLTGDEPIAYSELIDGAMYVQDPDGVRTYSMVADNLRQVALSPADSRALIRDVTGAH